ncbi:hypothetical protein NHQ30_002498 [Ciborinia camelliae]|nr:hypothetical protein NHQ30_002498 [Ciborinia camelliae]
MILITKALLASEKDEQAQNGEVKEHRQVTENQILNPPTVLQYLSSEDLNADIDYPNGLRKMEEDIAELNESLDRMEKVLKKLNKGLRNLRRLGKSRKRGDYLWFR